MLHRESLGKRPENECGKKCQRAYHEDRAEPEPAELNSVGAQGAGCRRQCRFRRHRAGHRHHENDRGIAADQNDKSQNQIVPGRVGI